MRGKPAGQLERGQAYRDRHSRTVGTEVPRCLPDQQSRYAGRPSAANVGRAAVRIPQLSQNKETFSFETLIGEDEIYGFTTLACIVWPASNSVNNQTGGLDMGTDVGTTMGEP